MSPAAAAGHPAAPAPLAAADAPATDNGPAAAPTLPYAFARRFGVVVADGQARHRPGLPLAARLEVQRRCGGISFAPVDDAAFEALLRTLYHDSARDAGLAAGGDLAALADSAAGDDLLDTRDDSPVVRLINALLLEAVRLRASDIHVEPEERRVRVRFRIDGALRDMVAPGAALAPLLASRLKVMARLDIAEKRVPQDGRVRLRIGGHEVDLRVATLPAQHGERIVLRLLDREAADLDLARLGMSQRDAALFAAMLARPHGMILVTGPTGAGKTTTLYAALNALNDARRNIMTVEDPIEYGLPGIGQMQVNAKIGLTFARGLRAILRQDPDVIMVGEIRDEETAEMAVRSSLTGHFVLSTLHTNSAVGSVTRLVDMGVERYLLAPMLAGLVAQRLVRAPVPCLPPGRHRRCRRRRAHRRRAGRGHAAVPARGLRRLRRRGLSRPARPVRGGRRRRAAARADPGRGGRARPRRRRARRRADPGRRRCGQDRRGADQRRRGRPCRRRGRLMPAFTYRALDAGGATRRGVIEASSAAAARGLLRERRMLPLAVAAAQGSPRLPRLRPRALAAVTRQLATLVGSDVRVEEALRLVAAQGAAAGLLLDLRGAILDGRSFAAALAAHPSAFPEFYRASVAAGEASGRLAEVLAHLADFVEARARAANRLGLALLYPALLAAVSLAMVAALLVYVVPDITRVFVARGAALPLLTRLLIAASDFVAAYGGPLLLVLAAAALAARRWLARADTRLALDRVLATGPAGGFVRRLAAARFAGTLATLVASDVPLVEAIATAAAVTPNRFVRARAEAVAARVREGATLRRAMDEAQVFPPLLIAVVASGEASGRLGAVLARAAADLQHDLDATVAALTALIEPAVLLAMGGLVLLLVLAILLPIIDLNTLAGA